MTDNSNTNQEGEMDFITFYTRRLEMIIVRAREQPKQTHMHMLLSFARSEDCHSERTSCIQKCIIWVEK